MEIEEKTKTTLLNHVKSKIDSFDRNVIQQSRKTFNALSIPLKEFLSLLSEKELQKILKKYLENF